MNNIQIDCKIEENIFRNFSNFNNFRFHKRWISLTLFPFIMIAFGFINKLTNSNLLFWIFVILGLLLPIGYLLMFKLSIQRQIDYYKLKTPKSAYFLIVTDNGIEIKNQKEQTFYLWDQIYLAVRNYDAHYLYITKDKAFILPNKDIQEGISPDTLWDFFSHHLDTIHTKDYRKK